MKHLRNGFWLTWKSIFGKLYFKDGMTKKGACHIIAERYNVTPKMVASYIEPITQRDKKHQIQIYDYRYKNLIRHIDKLLPQVFNCNPELSLNDISKGIDNLKGISLKERTLEKLIRKYQGMPRGPPIVKTETGSYRLNPSFYNY